MKLAFILLLLLLAGCSKIDLYSNKKIPECDNINDTGVKEICYNNLAIKKFDPGICMKIKSESYRDWCLGTVKQKPVSNEYVP